MTDDIFIFTEAYNCGLILKKCLESFFKYHDLTVNVFGRKEDFEEMGFFEKCIYHDLSNNQEIEYFYNHGHLGTAYIFGKVIQDYSGEKKYIIHFDSDTIFRDEAMSLLIMKLKSGYDLVGPRRCYKNNLNGRTDLNHYNDVTQTYFFGFNKNKITDYDFGLIQKMIAGHYNPLGHPILDFFDPISFDILNNGGKIFYLDFNLVGAQDENGNRINKYGEISRDLDFGDKIIHFAGIGSGMKFYKQGIGDVPNSYSSWAIRRFYIYMMVMYEKVIDESLSNDEWYKQLKNIL